MLFTQASTSLWVIPFDGSAAEGEPRGPVVKSRLLGGKAPPSAVIALVRSTWASVATVLSALRNVVSFPLHVHGQPLLDVLVAEIESSSDSGKGRCENVTEIN
jgi:hypothetical protein